MLMQCVFIENYAGTPRERLCIWGRFLGGAGPQP